MKNLRLLACVVLAGVGLVFSGCQSGPLMATGVASKANNKLLGKNFRPNQADAGQGQSDASLYASQLPTKREIEAYRKQHPAHLAGYQSTGSYGGGSGNHANCKT